MARTKYDNSVVTIRVNGEPIHIPTKMMCMGTLLTFHTNSLHYMSSQAMLDLIDQSADLLIELQVAVKQAQSAKDMVIDLRFRKDRVLERFAWLHEVPTFRESLMSFICEYVLRADGLGRLNGFTAVRCHAEEGSNVADSNSLCNPEIKTVRSV